MFTKSRPATSTSLWMALLVASSLMSSDTFAVVHLKTFILAGQSNVLYGGRKVDLPADLQQRQNNVKIFGMVGGGASVSGLLPLIEPWPNVNGWGPVQPSFWPAECDMCQTGSYLTVARDLAAAYPNDSIAIILSCSAPTTLACNWRPPSSGAKPSDCDPNQTDEYPTSLTGDTGTWGKGVFGAIDFLGSGYQADIAGMFWIQGESDAQTSTYAAEYKKNLTNLIKDLRAAYNVPRMPFVIGMIDTSSCWYDFQTVRQAETDVAATVDNVGINDTRAFPKDGDINLYNGVPSTQDDKGHYNAYGHVILGTDFAASMIRLLKNPTPGTFVEPSDLFAVVAGPGQVKLTWRDNSSTETGFVVERKAGSGAYSQLATVGAGAAVFAAYTDNSAAASTAYTYHVKAVNASSATAFSNEFVIVPFGGGDGLKAEYFRDTALTTLASMRVDTTINWVSGVVPVAGLPDRFSARWTGYVIPRYTENYSFFVLSDMMGTVWINNQLIIDPTKYVYIHPNDDDFHRCTPTHSGSVRLTAGQPYSIKVEYHVSGDYPKKLLLCWKTPGEQMQVIPKSQLFQNLPTTITVPVAESRRQFTSAAPGISVQGSVVRLSGLCEGTTMVISNPQGRVIRSVKNLGAVDMGRAAVGAYFVTVRDARGAVVNRAIMKR